MQWLLAIKYAPFNQFGGIGRGYELYGRREEVDKLLVRKSMLSRDQSGL